MQAVTVRPRERDSLRVLDIPDVQSRAGQVVVKVLQGGLCGTDAEITRGLYGEAPSGSPYLVLGHENLGLVESAPGGSSLSAGALAVSTVRRPCPEECLPCRSGENDMCLTGHYLERGIQGLHGFMSERYVEDPQYVVAVPLIALVRMARILRLPIVRRQPRLLARLLPALTLFSVLAALGEGAGYLTRVAGGASAYLSDIESDRFRFFAEKDTIGT